MTPRQYLVCSDSDIEGQVRDLLKDVVEPQRIPLNNERLKKLAVELCLRNILMIAISGADLQVTSDLVRRMKAASPSLKVVVIIVDPECLPMLSEIEQPICIDLPKLRPTMEHLIQKRKSRKP